MELKGLADLKRNLLQISKAVHDEVLPEAIGAAAEVIRAAIEQQAPRGETGLLSGSIVRQKMQSKDLSGPQVVGEKVGPSREAFYGLSVEYGHAIRSKVKGPDFGRVPKHPFVRPAADAAEGQAMAAAEAAAKTKLDSLGIK